MKFESFMMDEPETDNEIRNQSKVVLENIVTILDNDKSSESVSSQKNDSDQNSKNYISSDSLVENHDDNIPSEISNANNKYAETNTNNLDCTVPSTSILSAVLTNSGCPKMHGMNTHEYSDNNKTQLSSDNVEIVADSKLEVKEIEVCQKGDERLLEADASNKILNGHAEVETVILLDDSESEPMDTSVVVDKSENIALGELDKGKPKKADDTIVNNSDKINLTESDLVQEQPLANDTSKSIKPLNGSEVKTVPQVIERRKTTRKAAQKAESVIKKYALDEMNDVLDNDVEVTVIDPSPPCVRTSSISAVKPNPNSKVCLQCKKFKVCRFPVVHNKTLGYICDEACMNTFRSIQASTRKSTGTASSAPKPRPIDNVRRACSFCAGSIINREKCLNWETMEFCDIMCLEKYQVYIGGSCCQCKKSCSPVAIGKYCVRFGESVNQFCSNNCLDVFKRGLKLCSYCQKNISGSKDTYVNEKNVHQSYCSPSCYKKYQEMNSCNPDSENISRCVVCKQMKEAEIKILNCSNNTIDLCSEPCMLAYKFTNKMVLACCGLCEKYFDQNEQLKVYKSLIVINFSGNRLQFCSQTCYNVYITVNRKIVHCNKCNVRKYNFDMIEKVDANGQLLLFCSLTCIGVKITLPTTRNQPSRNICCDGCYLPKKLNFNVSMADGSIKSLCSQACVVKIQELSRKNSAPVSVPNNAGTSGRKVISKTVFPMSTPLPTIVATTTLPSSKPDNSQVVVPGCPRPVKNKAVMCYPKISYKEEACQSDPELAAIATKSESGSNSYIPLPLPLYVPSPSFMFNYPYPQPVPIPIPIPVPVFIPVPANSYSSVLNCLKNLAKSKSAENSSITELAADEDGLDESIIESSSRKRPLDELEECGSIKKNKVSLDNDDDVENSAIVENSSLSKVEFGATLKYTYGVNAWKQWILQKNSELEKAANSGNRKLKLFKTQLLSLSPEELDYSLCLFVKEVRKPNGEEYAPDSIFYLCLGIQEYLFENGVTDNIFTDNYFTRFTDCLDDIAKKFTNQISLGQQRFIVTRIEEEHLWECKQLGAHSPHVLINTLIYFNTKYFFLKTVEEHLSLSFNHITKIWKKNEVGDKSGKFSLLRFVKPKQTESDKTQSFDQVQNLENPVRCPVKLYEFYLSKCPPNIKSQIDVYYLFPERTCLPDSDVWYSKNSLSQEVISKMLNRVLMVKEINESLM